jgi:hypothetical protein
VHIRAFPPIPGRTRLRGRCSCAPANRMKSMSSEACRALDLPALLACPTE